MGAIPPSAILSRKGIARYGGVFRSGPLDPDPRKGLEFESEKLIFIVVSFFTRNARFWGGGK